MDKTICIIDDSPFVLKQIEEIIGDKEYNVIGHAKSGEEGIELYHKCKPDIVILDIIMPGIDGIEVAGILKREDPDVKILMLSSLCDEETIAELNKIEIKHLVAKPFEPEVLLEMLEAVYNNK